MPGTGTIALGSVCFGNAAIASRGLTLEKAAITCSQVMTMPSDDMQNPVPTILNGCCLGSNGPGLCIAMATVADFIRSSTLRSGIGAILRALPNGSRLSCGRLARQLQALVRRHVHVGRLCHRLSYDCGQCSIASSKPFGLGSTSTLNTIVAP